MFSDQTLISPLFPAPIYFLLLSLRTIGCRVPAHWLCELTRNSVPCKEDPARKECEVTVGEREKPQSMHQSSEAGDLKTAPPERRQQ